MQFHTIAASNVRHNRRGAHAARRRASSRLAASLEELEVRIALSNFVVPSTQGYVPVPAAGDYYIPPAYGGPATTQSTATTPPGMPTSLVASPVADTEVNLTWQLADSTEQSVVIERMTGSSGVWGLLATLPPRSDIYSDTSVYPSTSYSYRVVAENAAGNSAPSATQQATTLANQATLNAPGNLQAVAQGPTSVTLTFTNTNLNEPPGQGNYYIERSSNGVAYQIVALVDDATTAPSWTDTYLTPGTTYWYRVRQDSYALGTGAFTAPVSVTTSANQSGAPAAPTALAVTNNSAQSNTLSWTDNSGGTASFIVERATFSWTGTPSWTQVGTVGAGVTSFVDSTVAPESFYYYQVCATAAAGQSTFTVPVPARSASVGTGSPKVYDIGPGEPYPTLASLDWTKLGPGDTVNIHPNKDASGSIVPYNEDLLISVRGTAAAPIHVVGVPDPATGALPIIDGANATLATQFQSHYAPLNSLGVVLVGTRPDNNIAGWNPGYLDISGLKIEGGGNGSATNYVAGIYLEKADHLTLTGCEVTGNTGDGIFGGSQGDVRELAQITFQGDDVHGNGSPNTDQYHEMYLEGVDVAYLGNIIGPTAGGGTALKDRGAGTIIANNWIDGGGHLIDLVEAQNDAGRADTMPSYQETYVYGNVLFNPAPPTPDSGYPIYYGGDTGLPTGYRQGVLHFYGNTLITQRNQSESYGIQVFQAGSGVQPFDVRDNILYVVPDTAGAATSEMALLPNTGVASFGRNWVTPGWSTSFSFKPPFTGVAVGTSNFITNAGNTPAGIDVNGVMNVFKAGFTGPSITANADTATTQQGSPVAISVLANDTDQNAGPLGVFSVTQGADGSVVINADGTVRYTPNAGYAGTDTFQYTAADALGGRATGQVTVTVKQLPGAIEFSNATYVFNGNSGTATITLTRTGGSNGAVSVAYATSDGTAKSGVDYTATSGTLNFPDGATSESFTVSILGTSAADGNTYLNLNLGNPTGGATLGTLSTAVLDINASAGALQFSTPSYSVTEAGGATATITVTRRGGTGGTVSVAYATSDGTARAGTDYTAASGTLTFANGVTSQTFTVPILDDGVLDGNEALNLALTSPSGGATLGSQSTAVVNINEAAGSLQFSAPTYSVNESGGTTATITVTRTGGAGGSVSVAYATSDGTARAGTDYTATSGTLTFANGVTSQTFTVPILNDGVLDGNEALNLALTSPGGGATLGSQSTAVLNINEPAGTLQFSAPAYSVSELGGATATITVTRTGGAGGAVSVNYSTSNGTAQSGTDYTAASGTLTFANGVTSQTFTVPILNDGVLDGNEALNLALTSPGGGATLGSQSTAVLNINEPAGTLQFSAPAYSVSELGGATATITVTRTGGAGGAVSVNYSTSNGTAQSGTDYTAASGTLTFANGVTSQTFTVPILNDGVLDGNEALNLALTSPGGGATLGSQSTAVLNIIEAAGSLQFSVPTYSVSESGGSTATITVTRTGGAGGAVSVAYATSDGTARAGTDYTATSGTLTFANGVTSQTFTVPILDDGVLDGNEALNLSLTSPSGGATLGSQSTAVLNINEAAGSLQFSAPTYSVNELAGATATITVTRTGGAGGSATVNYATSDGTAQAGRDYTATSGTLTFANGVTSQTFTVPILSDGVADGSEALNLTLSGPTGGATLGGQSTATLTVMDAATPQITVSGGQFQAVAGQAFSNLVVATFTTASAQQLTSALAAINWGDGTSSAGIIVGTSNGVYNVLGSHLYAARGSYTTAITVSTSDASGFGTGVANVHGGWLKGNGASLVQANGQTFQAALGTVTNTTNTALAAPAYSAVIDWGDGTTSPAAILPGSSAGTFAVVGSHLYPRSRKTQTFVVTVSVQDAAGDGGRFQAQVQSMPIRLMRRLERISHAAQSRRHGGT